MAEAGSPNENSGDVSRRRSFPQSNQNMRPPYSGRGRGRGRVDPHVMKAINLFGVRDLRELLDRRHHESQFQGGPPADPSRNYLSDPEREDAYHHQQDRPTPSRQGGYPSRGQRGRGNVRGRGKPTFIHNPMNIKVQVSTSTGERNYQVDENDTLQDIRHVPDHEYASPFGEGTRGRGGNWRGRPREPRGRGYEERGRGGERRGRGRGRGLPSWKGEGGELRAKSAERGERFNEREVREYKARGRGKYARSRSVETRDKVEGSHAEGEQPAGRGDGVRGRGHRKGRGKRPSFKSDQNAQGSGSAAEQFVDAEEKNTEEPEPSEEHEQADGGDVSGLAAYIRDKLVITTQETKKRSVRFDLKDGDEKNAETNPENEVGDEKGECLVQENSDVHTENGPELTHLENESNSDKKGEIVDGTCDS